MLGIVVADTGYDADDLVLKVDLGEDPAVTSYFTWVTLKKAGLKWYTKGPDIPGTFFV